MSAETTCRAIAAVVILGTLATACGGLPNTSPDVGLSVDGSVTTSAVATGEMDPIQAEMIVDGFVTAAEMERALLAFVDCIEASGLWAESVTLDTDLRTFSMDIALGTGDPTVAEQLVDDCDGRFLAAARDLWIQGGDRGAMIESARQKRIRCFAEQAIEVQPGTTWDDLLELPDEIDLATLVACESA